MAVFTTLEEDDAADFLQRYDLGALTSFHGIVEGVENSNFMLRTQKGRFILTLFERRTPYADLPFFVALMQYLAQQGIACPQPIAARSGEALQQLAGKPALVVSFLDGLPQRRPKPDHCGLLGSYLGRLHQAAVTFEGNRGNSMNLPQWQRMLASLPTDAAEAAFPGVMELVSHELEELVACWPQRLPYGVIHADVFPDNVFFMDGAVSGIIDWYFACTDMLAYELAICINAWCFERDGSFNATSAHKLLRHYHRERPLDEAEQVALPLLARGAALRFLLSRLEDWLAPRSEDAIIQRKNPAEYIHKLRFARQVQSLGDWGVQL